MATTKRLRLSGWTAAIAAACACAAPILTASAAAALAAPGAAAASAVARPAPGTLQPYKARYQVSYRGLTGGQIEASFRPGTATGQWLYETHAFPNLLGRIAVSPEAYQRATMLVGSTGVKPLSFDFSDGSAEDEKDVRLRFDWTRNHVTGTADGKPIDLDVQPGTQDTASVQAAMILERVSGRSPTSFRIITGRKVRDYRYWSEGLQQVTSPFGPLTAEVWASQREGSTRVQKVWHVPSLGYVPVQAIQYRKGSAEVQMKLLSLER